ncbi:SusC/RagA family TonB-linked outer membrane protein [Ekhidna sp.]|uniref:SusC/RagA family TonB-linked outer membrane protein n=1 Tax=Ekhidna sp. TaxID=2608089 RepID=UPI003B5A443A
MKRILLLITLFSVAISFSMAQRTVSGKVTDDSGESLPGVNVVIKGTTTGTTTDLEGNYRLSVDEGAILVFSYVGFETQEVNVGSRTTVDITLGGATELQEVVVVGYGTQSKRLLTGNVATIGGEELKEIPNSSFQNTLVAKAAGVDITQDNGKVDGGINIRIRGQASISAGTQPLYVLDGIPLINNDESSNGGTSNPLLTLSPNEIESIDILKDASAAAIYGARGSNGVVVITTKRGSAGKTNFSVNYSYGVSEPTNRIEMLNGPEYIELFTEAWNNEFGEDADGVFYAPNGQSDMIDILSGEEDFFGFYGGNGLNVDTDWQDVMFQDGSVEDFSFSASGGDLKTQFFLSGAYNKTDGILRGNSLERFNLRSNVSHNFSEKFRAGINLGYSRTFIDRVANDNAFVTPVQSIAQSPLVRAVDANGEPNTETTYANFLRQDKYGSYETTVRRVTGKAFLEYQILDFLRINSDFAYDIFSQEENSWDGSRVPFQSTNGEAFWDNTRTENYILSNYLTFEKTFANDHNVNVVVGTELNESTRRDQTVTAIEFPTDDFQTPSSGAEVTGGTGSITRYSFASIFARAQYDFMGKYIFKASIRRDGSSRFGANERYGVFPAVSVGWIVSEESFLNNNTVVSFLKLRGSYGVTGNAEIGNFASRGLFGSASYNQRSGILLTQAPNNSLTWEETSQLDVGFEVGVLDNRVSIEFDYYNKRTDGLIFAVPLVPSSGLIDINSNIGEIENKGIEIVLNTTNIERDDFTWSTNFNIANNKSEVLSLPNDGADVITGQNIIREGEVVSAFYLLEYAGVDPDNGDALYYLNTENPDGTIDRSTTNDPNAAERTVVGNPFPELIAGLTNTINYKNFDFSFTFQGEWGASIYNGGGRFASTNADFLDNQTRDQLRRWQQPGDITDVPQARFLGGNGTANSTRYLREADFIRLRNASIGYTLPSNIAELAKLERVRFYISGINLLTFTSYTDRGKGFDPESTSDVGGSNPGNEFYSAPPARTISLGVNVNF